MLILGSTIKSSPSEELLGITIDSKLTFHKHITLLCSKVNQKRSAIHERNIQYPAIEAYKVNNDLSPVIMFFNLAKFCL